VILLAPPLHDASSGVFGAFSDVLPQIVVLLVVCTFVLHLIIASWIIQDARKLQNETGSADSVVLSPTVWFCIALLMGTFCLLFYWMIHRSTLNPRQAAPSRAE